MMARALGNGVELSGVLHTDSLGEVWDGTDAAGEPRRVRLLSTDSAGLRRMRRERSILIGLTSRYIVPWVDVFAVSPPAADGATPAPGANAAAIDVALVALPLAAPTLASQLADGLALNGAQVARVGADLALGLVAIHAAGLQHGAVATDMVTLDGEPARGQTQPAARISGLGVHTISGATELSEAADVDALVALLRATAGPWRSAVTTEPADVAVLDGVLDEVVAQGSPRTARHAASRLAAISHRLGAPSLALRRTPPPVRRQEVLPGPPVVPLAPELGRAALRPPVLPTATAEPDQFFDQEVEAQASVAPAPGMQAPVRAESVAAATPVAQVAPEVEVAPAGEPAVGAPAGEPAVAAPATRSAPVLPADEVETTEAPVEVRTRVPAPRAAPGAPRRTGLITASVVVVALLALGVALLLHGRGRGSAGGGVDVASTAQPSATSALPAGAMLTAAQVGPAATELSGLTGMSFDDLLLALYNRCDYYSPPQADRTQHGFVGFRRGDGINVYDDVATYTGSGAADFLLGMAQSVQSCQVLYVTGAAGQVLGTYRITAANGLPGLPTDQVNLLYTRVGVAQPAVRAVFLRSGNRVVSVLAQGSNPTALADPLAGAAAAALAAVPGS